MLCYLLLKEILNFFNWVVYRTMLNEDKLYPIFSINFLIKILMIMKNLFDYNTIKSSEALFNLNCLRFMKEFNYTNSTGH